MGYGNLQALMPGMGLQFYGMPMVTQGKAIYVKPYSGSDNHSGKRPDRAVKTLEKALSLATANANDVIYLFSEHGVTGTYTTDYLSTTLTWNKNSVHLVGINSGTMFGARSRVAWSSATYDGTATPMIDVTGSNCSFHNMQFWGGVADAQALSCVKLTGQRNVFKNCHIAGIGSDTQDAAGANSLWFYDSSENLFENCIIGTNTVKRGTAAVYEISYTTAAGVGSGNNIFRGCIITGWCESAGNYVFLNAPANNALGRLTLFDNCVFYNPATAIAGGAIMTQAFNVGASANGHILLQNSIIIGAGNVNTADTGLILIGAGGLSAVTEATDLGVAVVTTNA